MYLNAELRKDIYNDIGLTLTLDVFKLILQTNLHCCISWLTLTLDVFKSCSN